MGISPILVDQAPILYVNRRKYFHQLSDWCSSQLQIALAIGHDSMASLHYSEQSFQAPTHGNAPATYILIKLYCMSTCNMSARQFAIQRQCRYCSRLYCSSKYIRKGLKAQALFSSCVRSSQQRHFTYPAVRIWLALQLNACQLIIHHARHWPWLVFRGCVLLPSVLRQPHSP